jgi:methionine sulfoxide reductase heme-binding subunit
VIAATSHTWWYLARSSGLVAWVLLATAVMWGLLLSTRVLDRRPSPKWLTDLHRFLGGAAVVFTALHVGMLVADSYVHFGVAEILVPLKSSWRPVAVAWGVISLWILLAIEITSLAMKWLPRRLWRAVHFSSFALFVTATVHALTAGTDSGQHLFALLCDTIVTATVVLAIIRALGSRSRSRRNPVRSATARSADAQTADAQSGREPVASTSR